MITIEKETNPNPPEPCHPTNPRKSRAKGISGLSTGFIDYLEAAAIPLPIPEHCFSPPRKWRFDYAWLDQKLALEIEGAVWVEGRHTRGSGFVKDMEKYNVAVCLGWRILRCQPDELLSGRTLDNIRQALRWGVHQATE